jgi:general secretion pathway protein G
MISTYQRLQRRRAAGEIDGFTLIELLIVIVVLGILAAVVIFALGGITGKSALASCQADGATVSTALAAFNAQNPSTLTTVAGTGFTAISPPVTFATTGYSLWTPTATGYTATATNTVGTIAIGTPVSAATAPSVDTLMEADLTSTAATFSGPYIQSWPSNATHYGFAMGWVQQTVATATVQATWSAQLFVVTGDYYGTTTSNGATYTTSSSLNGSLTASLINNASPMGNVVTQPAIFAYTGPASCTNVS